MTILKVHKCQIRQLIVVSQLNGSQLDDVVCHVGYQMTCGIPNQFNETRGNADVENNFCFLLIKKGIFLEKINKAFFF